MGSDGARASLLLTITFVAAGLLLGVWLGLAQMRGAPSILDRIENLTLDWRFLLAGPRPAPPGIVIAAIDDRTVNEAEGHTVSRKALARIIREIASLGPRALALDIAFPDAKDAGADAELADALRSAPSVVAAIAVFGDGERPDGQAQSPQLALAPRAAGVLWPAEPIRDAAQAGLANVSTDASGVPRYIPMLFDVPDGVAPSFALAAVAVAAQADPVIAADSIEVGGRTAPMDLGYHMPIRYYGPAGAVPHFSAARALRGDLDPVSVGGRIIVLGLTATGLADTFATPFDRLVPGVEVMATAIGNLSSGEGLVRTPSTRRIDAATTIALPAALVALMGLRRAGIAFAIAALVSALWVAGVFLAFAGGYWLAMAAPLALGVPLAAAHAGARLVVARAMGLKLAADKSALAKFQSPAMVDHILKRPDFLEKPVRGDVAVLFLDLTGSTAASESMDLERARDLLHGMQTLVEREVASHGGVVINFMGDGVLAAFGLPEPKSGDAARALAAVEGLREGLIAWLADWPEEARAGLDFRIGAHFGPAMISRLGSPTHQQITIAGDTVNVASRLLEVAKARHCRVVVTEDLIAAAGATPGVVYAPVTVPIRGRTAALRVRVRT